MHAPQTQACTETSRSCQDTKSRYMEYMYCVSENSFKKSNFTLCLIYRIQNIHFLWFSNRKISLTNWFSHAIYIPSKHTSSCKKYQRWTTRLSFCLIPPLAKNLKVILFHCVVFKFTCWSIIYRFSYNSQVKK